MSRKDSRIVDARELSQVQFAEHTHDLAWVVDSVSVEADAWTSDGDREQQLTTGAQHALKLHGRFMSTQWIEGISVPSEADVLRDVQAADRLQRPIGKGQRQHRPYNRLQPLDLSLKWAYVDVGDVGQRGEKADQIHARANVDVALRCQLGDTVRRP